MIICLLPHYFIYITCKIWYFEVIIFAVRVSTEIPILQHFAENILRKCVTYICEKVPYIIRA